MIVFSLMASSHSGCPPGLVLYQEKGSPRPFKEFQPLLGGPGTRQETNRSSVLALTPYEQSNVFKLTNRFDGYRHFVSGLPLLPDVQDMRADSILFSFGIDEEWAKHTKFLQFLMSGLSEIKENYLDPSIFPGFIGVQASLDDINLQHVASADFELNECFREKASRLHPNGNYYVQEANCDLVHDLPSSKISIHTDGLLSFIGRMTDMKDLIFVLEEFTLAEDLAQLRKQVLVPHSRWSEAINWRSHTYSSSLKLDTTAPLKSHEKVKLKPARKRKTKKAARERDLYKDNTIHACEMLLSLMMDKKRNRESVMNLLKKAGPELPQLLTQFSASITGTGLAVLFTVVRKVACGSMPFCASNLLTSGFSIGLFWLSLAVNKLRGTIMCIRKNSVKLGFEEEMMMRVDESVNNIFFRAAALMALLILRFA